VPCVYCLFEDIRARIYTKEALQRHEEELALDANEHALDEPSGASSGNAPA
jgi:hypothetical protein